MLRYRAVMVGFWQDPEFSDWPFEAKAFYLYLISSPYTTLSGFMPLAIKHIVADTGLSEDKVKKLLQFLMEQGKIKIAGQYIWIRKFFKYQNMGGVKVTARIVRELREILNPATAPLIKEMCEMYPELADSPGFERLIQAIEETPVAASKEEYSNTLQLPRKQPVPYKKIVEIYHEECPDLPRVQVMNERRKRLIRARWKEHPDLEWWRQFFKRVHASDFLCGRVPPKGDRPPFLADLEWLVRPSNFAKVIEGRYDNRESKDNPEIDSILREFMDKEAK